MGLTNISIFTVTIPKFNLNFKSLLPLLLFSSFSLSLLTQQFALGLEPVPFLLDVGGGSVHIHLLLNLGLFKVSSLLVFEVSGFPVFLFSLAKFGKLGCFQSGLLFLLMDLFLLLLKLVDLLVL